MPYSCSYHTIITRIQFALRNLRNMGRILILILMWGVYITECSWWKLNVSITHAGQSNGVCAAISDRPGTVMHGGR